MSDEGQWLHKKVWLEIVEILRNQNADIERILQIKAQ